MTDKRKHRKGPTTQLGRLWRMTGVTTSIATRVARQQVLGVFQSPEERQREREELMQVIGREIADALGEMKGAVMKVGQIASQMQDILPKGVADALSVLQKNSPPMPWETIRAQIRRELGDEPDVVFAHFDSEPFAAASIGQVHRARLQDGREVVVKVQYPAVKESIDSDMKHLRRILRLGGLLKVEPQALDAIFAEIREQLHEELDYVQEAANIQRFRAFHEEPWVVIPQVITAHSTGKVLTLTFEPGDDLDGVEHNPDYAQDIRNLIGTRLFDIISRQIYELGLMHSDPHPGNFAFRPDGTLIIYDFGAVKRISTQDAADFRAVTRAALDRDYARLEQCLVDLGVRKDNDSVVDDAFYAEWLDMLEPIFDYAPFDYGDSLLHLAVARKAATASWKYLDSFQPSARVLQIDRILSGHYWTMARLGVNASFRSQLDTFM